MNDDGLGAKTNQLIILVPHGLEFLYPHSNTTIGLVVAHNKVLML